MMRPVRRGASPEATDFSPYDSAKPYLISRIGQYCSYCERRIPTNLAIEHVQPKGLPSYFHLIGRWDNFLLGCVNCNSCKGDKDVDLSAILLPDRDNTFYAFSYMPDGSVMPSENAANDGRYAEAAATLSLVGLDKKISDAVDENEKLVAMDRVGQRLEVWSVAQDSLHDLNRADSQFLRRQILKTALGYGYFSIWMNVFSADIDMCNRFIDGFAGTRQSGCFDLETCLPISRAPNPDGLPFGGKL